jgi:SAM-dependent methyltransferase
MSNDDFFGQYPNLLTTRYNAWSDHFSIKDARVLDLGCNYATAGDYFLERGALKYVGVDLDSSTIERSNKLLSNKFEKYKFSLVTSSIDDFLDNNIETFDVVLLGVIIHGTGDIIELFRKISKITNRVVVETAHPFYLTYKSNSNLLSTDDLYNLEYKTAVVELHEEPTSKHVNFLHSMKYLSTIFNRLGFVENYKPYEQLKKELPNIYGFNLNSRLGLAKRYILIFNKTPSQEQTPIVWEENFEKF